MTLPSPGCSNRQEKPIACVYGVGLECFPPYFFFFLFEGLECRIPELPEPLTTAAKNKHREILGAFPRLGVILL